MTSTVNLDRCVRVIIPVLKEVGCVMKEDAWFALDKDLYTLSSNSRRDKRVFL